MGLNDYNPETHYETIVAEVLHEIQLTMSRSEERARAEMEAALANPSEPNMEAAIQSANLHLGRQRIRREAMEQSPRNWCDVARLVICLARLNPEDDIPAQEPSAGYTEDF